MKLHKNLCEAVIYGLDQVFVQDAYARQAVEQLLLSNKKWGARDRAFIAEHLYTLIRYYRLYCYAAGLPEISSTADEWQVLGAYFLDRFTDLDVPLTEGEEQRSLPPWPEWLHIDAQAIQIKLAQGRALRRIRESVPDWLDERGSRELGPAWDPCLHALNQSAPVCIRVNTLKATRQAVEDFLRSEGVEFEVTGTPSAPSEAIIIHSKKNLRVSHAYRGGWFEIQDISSQQVAPTLDPRPGMMVIDACAGTGGKSLHIASLMQGQGEIIALDLYPDKLKELETRARRNGVANIKTVLYTDGLEEQYRDRADRLLLDVPCSATGVIRRHPDTKYKLTSDELDSVISRQQDILKRYSVMLRPGGILVYATCSILPAENEMQTERFLSAHPSFRKLSEKTIMPQDQGGDGFYICKMIRAAI